MRRALAISEQSFGRNHPSFARSLKRACHLARWAWDWVEAASLHARAKPIMTAARRERGQNGDGALAANTRELRATRVYRADFISAEAREEGFELAQWALQTGAADALAQMSVRFAKGAGPLASWCASGRTWSAVVRVKKAPAGRGRGGRCEGGGRDPHVMANWTRGSRCHRQATGGRFPEYATSSPKPLTVAAVQAPLEGRRGARRFPRRAELRPAARGDAGLGGDQDRSALARHSARHGGAGERVAKRAAVARPRGLWSWPGTSAAPGLANRGAGERCREPGRSLGRQSRCRSTWPRRMNSIVRCSGPFADLTQGKRLIVVPSGPLTSLPFHVLVTGPTASWKWGLGPGRAAWKGYCRARGHYRTLPGSR